MNPNRRYMVVPVTAAVRNQVREAIEDGDLIQTSLQTIRTSLDGTQAIIKWNHARLGRIPDRLRTWAIANGIVVLTHAQALTLMQSPEWSPPVTP